MTPIKQQISMIPFSIDHWYSRLSPECWMSFWLCRQCVLCTGPKRHGLLFRLSTKSTVLNSTLSPVCTGLYSISYVSLSYKRAIGTRCSDVAETAGVTTDRLTLTITLNMTYVNFISLIELSIRGILYSLILTANTLNCFKRRRDI